MFLRQQTLRPAKNFHFRAFHIAFQKIRRWPSPHVLIQRHSVNLDRIARAICDDMTESAIGGRRGIRARKENRARFRPHGLFLNGNCAKIIARNVRAKSRCNLWIGFERYDTAIFPDNSRGQQREETNIRADIVKDHAGTEIPPQSGLHFGLAATFEVSPAGARVQVEPQSLRGTALDLHPDQ